MPRQRPAEFVTDNTDPSPYLSWAGVWDGFRRILPATIYVVPFGIAFGTAAIGKGISAPLTLLMSGAVFAGASQFAALDFWSTPLAFMPLLLTIFAVNARHIVLGAALAPWLAPLTPYRKYGVIALLSDANWALATKAHEQGERDVGLLVGSGLGLWVTWMLGTLVGALAGHDLGDLSRFGLDVVALAFFASVLIG